MVVSCPCEGEGADGITWDNNFNVTSCTVFFSGDVSVDDAVSGANLSVSSDEVACAIFGASGPPLFVGDPFEPGQIEACNVSLVEIAANDGIPCQ